MQASGNDAPSGADEAILWVDRAGVVVRSTSEAQHLFDSAGEPLQGRDFFRDIAPGTNLPAFRGRFLRNLRSGPSFTDSFDFVLGFSPAAARLQVDLASEDADLYRLTFRVRERFQRPDLQDAIALVDQRASSVPVSADLCEREPIHAPGAIQPHAALIAFDLATLEAIVCSANSSSVLGLEPNEVLGRPLAELLPPAVVRAIESAAARKHLDPAVPLRVGTDLEATGGRAVVTAHVHGGRLIVEIEPAPQRAEDFDTPPHFTVSQAIGRLRTAHDLETLTEAAVADIAALTGFQRVLIYRFDREWNGEAIAEMCDEGYASLLHLHFPASDIPAQARALYLRAPARFVIDRDYVPVPLVAQPGGDNATVDLSFAQARSLSPIHLEYQKNLGVNGSMSSSVVVDGRLWGLVIGHHRKPHYLAPETRAAVTALTDALSLRIGEMQREQAWQEQESQVVAEARLLRGMAGADSLQEALLSGSPNLLDLFEATGAAIVEGESVSSIGVVPDEADMTALVGFLRGQPGKALFYATDHLADVLPGAGAFSDKASGVLAAFTSPTRERILLWLRPEVTRTIAWGGDPNKAAQASEQAPILLPRRSFERWLEIRRETSKPWLSWHSAAALRLADAVDGVAMRHNRRLRHLAAKQDELLAVLAEKDRALFQKDILTREIDHRVKNSLQIVGSFLQMHARSIADEKAKAIFEETYARVMTVARIHDSLYHSEEVEDVDIGQTIATLCADIASGITAGEHHLNVAAEPGIRLAYNRAMPLALIATELVTNALKYAYPFGHSGRVDVAVGETEGRIRLTVADYGQGLPDDWETGARPGGLGMRLIRTLLEQIGGEMQVESSDGARFLVYA